MYFLIGIWGHGRRIYAALKFVLYTMFGSILMLVAILWLYRITAVAGYPTFDVAQIQSLLANGTITLPLRTEYAAVRRVFPGVCHQSAALPAAHLAAGCAHRSPDGGLGDARGRAAEDGHVRHAAISACRCSRTPRAASLPRSPCWPSSGSSTARWWPWCRWI
jgi:hypothetical protein